MANVIVDVTEIDVGVTSTGPTVGVSSTEMTVEVIADGITISVDSMPISISLDANDVIEVVEAVTLDVVEVAEQGPPGIDGANGTGLITFAFSWGDASPATLLTVEAGKMVLACSIAIDVAFDGASPTLSIGDVDDDESLMTIDENDPSHIGMYQAHPCKRFSSSTELLLTIQPGSGSEHGSGVVTLFIED